jgi:hypothetical protein
MILENKQLLDSLLRENLLQISTNNHRRTWKHYYEQYHNAFCVLLDIAKQKRYRTNRQFMPFLFIMRHSLELFLKMKISELGTPWANYGETHNLTDLSTTAQISEPEFLECFDCLNCNSEGDCWRYPLARDGKPHFVLGKQIKVLDACNYYCLFLDNDDSLTKGGIDKKLQWELTFHTKGCDTLGKIGTQYDFAIVNILHAIKSKQISINDIYIPLLFLLRHCLEIKLKFSIINLGNIVENRDSDNAHSTHKVNKLYRILTKHIKSAIESITNPEFKKQSEDLRQVTEQYKDAIASLDANSFLFRFPMDQNGNEANFIPKSDCVSEILKLYWKSDSFLCFVVVALYEYGVLKIGDDKMREYYE